jgi:hypothetical protein
VDERETIDRILSESHIIAVVGLSEKPDRPSNRVATYLQEHGYHVIPVNPALTRALGEQAYPDLAAVPGPIDVVDIFRRSEDVPPIVEAAVARGVKAVWMQEGVVNDAAAARARSAGLLVVMNRCIKKEHEKRAALAGPKGAAA